MEYSLIKTHIPFTDNILRCTKNERDNNYLWKINNFLLLHANQDGNDAFIHSLEKKQKTKFSYEHLPVDILKQVFRYLYLNGDLKKVVFSMDFENDRFEIGEIMDLTNLLMIKQEERRTYINKAEEKFAYLLEEEFGGMWYFECWRHENGIFTRYTLYASAILQIQTDYKGTEELGFALEIIKELLGFMGIKRVSFDSIRLVEYEKKIHPLSSSHKLLETLFEESGEAVRKKLGIPENEYSFIKLLLLGYTQNYEDLWINDENE